MKIHKISFVDYTNSRIVDKTDRNIQDNPAPQLKTYNPAVIRDYNVTFGGRTPEDFYAQDFNRENMPSTMKNYLNYDYGNRQHIPPEQMMQEVFKYLELADNFDDVKEVYPDEELFRSLHDNYKKHTKNILAEIKMAKEISDIPLFKDGSDDFGMYLLKKIYLNGKTLKEINKDFQEKDINDEYKGLITKPINYETTSAFGIRYPKQEFWHSFIATRDEYKKFFVCLPKKTLDAETLQKETGFTYQRKMPKQQMKPQMCRQENPANTT